MDELFILFLRAYSRPLCDHCLGRLFGGYATGLDDPQRSRALKVAASIWLEWAVENNALSPEGHPDPDVLKGMARLMREDRLLHPALERKIQLPDIEPRESCWLCEDLFDEMDTFAELVMEAADGREWESYLVGSKVESEIMAREEALWSEIGLDRPESIKLELNREIGKKVEKLSGKIADLTTPDVTVVVDTRFNTTDVTVRSIYLYGRYRKLSREIPQTKWPCRRCKGAGCDACSGTGKMYPESVEELVAHEVLLDSGGTGQSFHGMGREDIDALMLGNGRPFVLEIKEPMTRTLDHASLEKRINDFARGKVEVMGLRPSDRKEVVSIKNARNDKAYEITIEFREIVSIETLNYAMKYLTARTIHQKTPLRVIHRRADKIRDRVVKQASLVHVDGSQARIRFTAEAGTYIKEMCTGDEGRTDPSVSSLTGIPCRVMHLDVVGILDGENKV